MPYRNDTGEAILIDNNGAVTKDRTYAVRVLAHPGQVISDREAHQHNVTSRNGMTKLDDSPENRELAGMRPDEPAWDNSTPSQRAEFYAALAVGSADPDGDGVEIEGLRGGEGAIPAHAEAVETLPLDETSPEGVDAAKAIRPGARAPKDKDK